MIKLKTKFFDICIMIIFILNNFSFPSRTGSIFRSQQIAIKIFESQRIAIKIFESQRIAIKIFESQRIAIKFKMDN